MALIGFLNEPTEAVNVKVETETVEDAPDCMSVFANEEACNSAQAVIDRQDAELELEDVQGQIEALEARETELEKELGSY